MIYVFHGEYCLSQNIRIMCFLMIHLNLKNNEKSIFKTHQSLQIWIVATVTISKYINIPE